jgi:hypothetical protein
MRHADMVARNVILPTWPKLPPAEDVASYSSDLDQRAPSRPTSRRTTQVVFGE